MSYDLMVFDPAAAPREREEFMQWYDVQTEWAEDHEYDDPAVTTPALRAWFLEMIETFPAMNGPYGGDEDDDDYFDNPHVSDYCIGKSVIYTAFAWSVADEAYETVCTLAAKHGVGFFDVSSDDAEIRFPN